MEGRLRYFHFDMKKLCLSEYTAKFVGKKLQLLIIQNALIRKCIAKVHRSLVQRSSDRKLIDRQLDL